MECQPKVFAEASLFDKLLRFRLDSVRKDNESCKGGHVLLMRLNLGKHLFTGKINVLFQFLRSEIFTEVEINLLMVFHCAEHVLLTDEIIFIPEEENSPDKSTIFGL